MKHAVKHIHFVGIRRQPAYERLADAAERAD